MKAFKGLLHIALYGVLLGTISAGAAVIVLHVVFGFSMIPCQFDQPACEIAPQLRSMPIPHADLPFTGDPIGVSPFSSRLLFTILKPGLAF